MKNCYGLNKNSVTKKMLKFLQLKFLLMILVVCMQCSKEPLHQIDEFEHSDFLNEISLKGTVLDSTEIQNPFQIETYNDYLFVSEPGDFLVSIYDIKKNKIVRRVVNKGRGPGEMISVSSLQVYKDNLYVYCAGMKVINVYDIADLFNPAFNPIKTIPIESTMCDNAKILNDSVVVYNSSYPARVIYGQYESNLMYSVGDYSFLSNNNKVPEIWLSQVFRNRMVCNSKSNEYALFNMFTDVIEFYKDTSLVRVLKGPDKFDADVELVTRGNISMVQGKLGKTRDAYRSVYANDDVIFVGYSGDFVKNERYSLNQIFIFDWNGSPIYKVTLDIPIASFCVNFKNNKLFGFNFNKGYPYLISYDITNFITNFEQ